METNRDNAIDFKETTIEEAAAAGSPAEQPQMTPEQMDVKYAAPQAAEKASEETMRAQEVLQTLQATPEVVQIQEAPTPQQEPVSSVSPDDFVKRHGGFIGTVPRNVQGAADFLKSRRLAISEKLSTFALPAAGVALAAMVSSLSGATTLSALAAGGPVAIALGGVVPAAALGAGIWFGYKGVRNFFAERSFEKTFGRSVS